MTAAHRGTARTAREAVLEAEVETLRAMVLSRRVFGREVARPKAGVIVLSVETARKIQAGATRWRIDEDGDVVPVGATQRETDGA